MRKIFLAGIAAVCMLMMGMTAFAMEPAVPRRVRAHGACHQQVESLLRNRVRHDCTYADADGDGICDSCGWHQDRHHCVDADGHCLNGACNYENCGYGCGTGYCRGYCNSLAASQEVGVLAEEVPAGTALSEAAPEGRRPDDQGMAGAGSGSGSPAGGESGNRNAAGGTAQYSDPAGTVQESGGAGTAQGGTGYYGYANYGSGCYSGGHHGNGHHGNGHHGCEY